MSAQPLASIIITDFNYGQYLRNAIDSALDQTYPNVEVIVVDDGSTDNSRDVIASYEGQVLAVYKSNGGQGSAFNAGFAVSQGQYIFFLDADDQLFPDCVAKAIELLQSGRFSKVHWYLQTFRGEELLPEKMPWWKLGKGNCLPRAITHGPHSGASAPTSCNAWMRWWLELVLPMPEPPFRTGADSYLFSLAPLFGEIGRIDETLGLYHISEKGITGTLTASRELVQWEAVAKSVAKWIKKRVGVEAKIEDWKQKNGVYLRYARIVQAGEEIAKVIPEGEPFGLLHGGEWREPSLPLDWPVSSLTLPPRSSASDRKRIFEEISGFIDQGTGYLAVAGPQLWNDASIQECRVALRRRYRQLHENRLVSVFSLTEAPEEPWLRASIIIDNYNYAAHLRGAIESALEQRYPDVEVIVVDDGSTDDSRQIIASFGDRITAVLKPNQGQGSALNAGYAVSHGEVVFFLDADDMFMPETVERVIPHFQDQHVAKVHWYLHMHQRGKLLGKVIPESSLEAGELLPPMIEAGPFTYMTAPTSGNAFPRWWLDRVLPIPETEFRINADSYLYTLAPVFGTIVALPDALGYYHWSLGGILDKITASQMLTTWEGSAKALSEALALELGIETTVEHWRTTNPTYRILRALELAESEVERLVPADAPLVIIASSQWKPHLLNTRRELKRVRVPKGRKGTERTIDQITALASNGFQFLAVDGDVFDQVGELQMVRAALKQRFHCLLENERVAVFDLTTAAFRQASVIIDNYNYAQHVGQAIDSALEQTWPNVEVIVVDDGSTDDSRSIIDAYGDKVIKVYKKNGGQGSAFNAGFSASNGEVIFLLDADDMLLPEAVATVMPHFDNGDVAKVQWYLYRFNGTDLFEELYPWWGDLESGELLPQVLVRGPYGYTSSPTSGNAFARWWMDEVMPMPAEDFRIYGETYLLALAPVFGTVVSLPDVLSLYRVGSGSMSSAVRMSREIEAWEAMARALQKALAKKLGIEVDIEQWRTGSNFYRTVSEAERTERAILDVLSANDPVAVIGVSGWTPALFRGWSQASRLDFGPKTLIHQQLKRIDQLANEGTRHLIVAGKFFDETGELAALRDSLRDRYPSIFDDHRATVFDLRPSCSSAPVSVATPRASVVIINYNYGRYLRRTIESALEQTYPETEVIVVDDGSTDDSPEIIADFGNRIASVLKQNGGMGSAMNAGFAASTGDVIFFLDADDMFLPEAIEKVMPHFEEAGLAKVQWYLHYFQGTKFYNSCVPEYPLETGDLLPQLLKRGSYAYATAPTSGNAFPRWWLEKVMPMDENAYRFNSESYLCSVAPIFGPVKALPDTLGFYHGSADGMTQSSGVALQLTTWEACARGVRQLLLDELGLEGDLDQWRRDNPFYQRMKAVQETEAEVEPLVPEDAVLAIVPEYRWKPMILNTKRSLRRIELSRNAKAARVIAKVEAAAAEGCDYLAVDGPFFDERGDLSQVTAILRTRFRVLIDNNRVILFSLSDG